MENFYITKHKKKIFQSSNIIHSVTSKESMQNVTLLHKHHVGYHFRKAFPHHRLRLFVIKMLKKRAPFRREYILYVCFVTRLVFFFLFFIYMGLVHKIPKMKKEKSQRFSHYAGDIWVFRLRIFFPFIYVFLDSRFFCLIRTFVLNVLLSTWCFCFISFF